MCQSNELEREIQDKTGGQNWEAAKNLGGHGQSRITRLGGPRQFYWRAHMTSFMTSSYVKVTFSLIRKVPVRFFR